MATAIYGKLTGPWADMVDPVEGMRCAAGIEQVAPIVIFAKNRLRGRVLARFRVADEKRCAALELFVVHPNDLASTEAQSVMRDVRKFVEKVAPEGRLGVRVDKATVGTLSSSYVADVDAPVTWPDA